MNIKGKIKVINATNVVSDKFSKREFVLTENSSQYPQDLLIQLTQDKCSLIDGFNVGQEIEVQINLRGREWINPQGEAKYFNTIEAWKINGATTQETAKPRTKLGNIEENFQEEAIRNMQEDDDDLPF
jgi:hypothetical protein